MENKNQIRVLDVIEICQDRRNFLEKFRGADLNCWNRHFLWPKQPCLISCFFANMFTVEVLLADFFNIKHFALRVQLNCSYSLLEQVTIDINNPILAL